MENLVGHQQNEAITKKLSEFAFNFRYANLPREVIEQAKLFILDTLGFVNFYISEALKNIF